jgi:hypothetical protein
MPRPWFAALAGAAAFAGCSSSVPQLHQPDRIEAYCGDRVAMITAIESIVASTSDAPENVAIPAPRALAAQIKAGGGVLAYWNDQLLLLPAVAKMVGAPGDYVTLGAAAISSGEIAADSRRIYLTVKTASGPRTFALRAFDIQDVCNEGKLKS